MRENIQPNQISNISSFVWGFINFVSGARERKFWKNRVIKWKRHDFDWLYEVKENLRFSKQKA